MAVARRRAGFWRRHRRLKWIIGGSLLALAAFAVTVSVMMHRAEPMLRELVVEKLQEHFHARVELASFHISLVKGLSAEGKGLKIWPASTAAGTGAGATDSSRPLISLAQFRFHAPLHYKPGTPIRISVVELNGLDVDVPPKSHRPAHCARLHAKQRTGIGELIASAG